MSTRNNKKKKDKKLRSLFLLLFLTIIMLGTASYAWFTANQVVTIQALDLQVEASNGLQISTDAVSWKSVITNNIFNCFFKYDFFHNWIINNC